MKNSLGNPARGEAFYPREKEIRKIYRVLNAGTSIYLSAPRRVGKTSILRYIEEFPEENFHSIYVITEDLESQNDFFKVIFEELIKSEAINRLAKVSAAVKDTIASILGRVKQFYNVELRDGCETDYYEILTELFSSIKKEPGNLVILIDEFPQTIQNILNKEGVRPAEQFIQKNRVLRHHKHVLDKVRFIYTGSLSLYPIIEKVTSLTAVNDLMTVEVEPLPYEQAIDFMSRLLETDGVNIERSLLDYILNKIGWLIPFHLQLIEREIVDIYKSNGNVVDEKSIDLAFDQVVHIKNKSQFKPYFERLARLFRGNEYEFVSEILQYVAVNDLINLDVLNGKALKYNLDIVDKTMEMLEGDGYLLKSKDEYRYASPMLKLWWQKHICK
ncbi:hypothetical protein FBD94_08310 [Pedobacter hiemivivus]|uniref:ATPase domain-containing protein n=1 Tax=Pedobacter hiemivivus TaxID=2530454 RepID=A0A4U1GDS1_9SPHI|nr:ATP-binding protein [Pedobacter hiemivivus]TKC62215.1 hypothetical protein FBD94_08310 [Pedobacter hiemivivus]